MRGASISAPRRRLRRTLPIAARLCLTLLVGWALPAAAQDAYEALPGAKAIAVLPAQPDRVRAVVHGQPNDLAAATAARQQCEAQAGEPCELVRLNDEHVTTGREIQRRVGDAVHPLFLWRFARHRTELFLAGSIHVLKPSLYPLPRQLTAAFERADFLVLEVNVADLPPQQLQQRTLQYALLPDQQTLGDVVPQPLMARLEAALADYGMSAAMVDRAKPALVMNQIVVARLMSLGYLPDSGVENHFLARRTDQQVLQLESLDEQLALLFDQPMKTQLELLDETLEVADEIEPVLVDMLTAWLAGDDAGFLEAFKAQSGDSPESRAFTRQLLEARNHTMAAGIRDLLSSAKPGGPPQTYFVLVGAAHLVGDEGIVPLLARHGIDGRRVMSDDTIEAALEDRP